MLYYLLDISIVLVDVAGTFKQLFALERSDLATFCTLPEGLPIPSFPLNISIALVGVLLGLYSSYFGTVSRALFYCKLL